MIYNWNTSIKQPTSLYHWANCPHPQLWNTLKPHLELQILQNEYTCDRLSNYTCKPYLKTLWHVQLRPDTALTLLAPPPSSRLTPTPTHRCPGRPTSGDPTRVRPADSDEATAPGRLLHSRRAGEVSASLHPSLPHHPTSFSPDCLSLSKQGQPLLWQRRGRQLRGGGWGGASCDRCHRVGPWIFFELHHCKTTSFHLLHPQVEVRVWEVARGEMPASLVILHIPSLLLFQQCVASFLLCRVGALASTHTYNQDLLVPVAHFKQIYFKFLPWLPSRLEADAASSCEQSETRRGGDLKWKKNRRRGRF